MGKIRPVLSRMMTAFGVDTFKELAHKLGLSPNTLDVWKRRGGVPEKHLLKCINMTGYDLNWLKTGEGSPTNESSIVKLDKTINVSLIQAGAGEGIYNFEPQNMIVSLNPGKFPYLIKNKTTAVEIVGDSMEPDLRQGDYILISPVKEERKTEDGIYAIRIDGAIKVKRLHFKLDGTIEIISINKEYGIEVYSPKESQVEFVILGKKQLLISR